MNSRKDDNHRKKITSLVPCKLRFDCASDLSELSAQPLPPTDHVRHSGQSDADSTRSSVVDGIRDCVNTHLQRNNLVFKESAYGLR